jgi:carbamoyltransferase
VFHDPAASIVVDGQIVAAAVEERFSRRRARRIPVSGWSRRTSSWSRAAGRTP